MILKFQHFEMYVNAISSEIDDKNLKEFFSYFDKVNPEGKEYYHIQLGWMVYCLKKRDGLYRISTPNFFDNPHVNTTENLEVALNIHFEQVNLLKIVNNTGENCLFNQKIIYQKGVFESHDFYLERTSVDEESDSGWFIGSLENEGEYKKDELVSIYVYELLFKNPALLKLLLLPTGFLVVVESNQVVSIVDEYDKELIL